MNTKITLELRKNWRKRVFSYEDHNPRLPHRDVEPHTHRLILANFLVHPANAQEQTL